MTIKISKHVHSDIRYRKTCALTSHFVLGVGGGRSKARTRGATKEKDTSVWQSRALTNNLGGDNVYPLDTSIPEKEKPREGKVAEIEEPGVRIFVVDGSV